MSNTLALIAPGATKSVALLGDLFIAALKAVAPILVFVLVAGDTPTPQATITVPAPDLETFGAMSDRWVQAVAATSGLVLTDDFAPIDRLMGRPD